MAWRQVWPPAALILGLAILLAPHPGRWAVAGLGLAALGWSPARPMGELVRYTGGFILFAALRNLADDYGGAPRYIYPIAWDEALFGTLPTFAMTRRPALDLLCVIVYLSYFLVPPTVLVLLWRCWPTRLPRYVTATLALYAASLVVHWAAPTAPPWMAGLTGHLPPVAQVVAEWFGETPSYGAGIGLSGNLVAAMPSVHVGVSGLIALTLRATPLGWPSGGYAAAMLWAVIYGGEHYAVDALAGLLVAAGCHRASVNAGR
jgi:membrane-associated phospholipid phosphatase